MTPSQPGPETVERDRGSHEEEHRRRVLTEGMSAIVGDIADAVVTKDDDLFFLTDSNARVPLQGPHGFGLYYHDCRYLSGYELTLADMRPIRIVATGEQGYLAVFQLTNPEIETREAVIHRETIGMKWERLLDGKGKALYDRLQIENFGATTADFEMVLSFKAGFEDIFAIRELVAEELGTRHPPGWAEGVLVFRYEGQDRVHRSLAIHFDPGPTTHDATAARYRLTIPAREQRQLLISMVLSESEDGAKPEAVLRHDPAAMRTKLHAASEEWMSRETRLMSDSLVLNRMVEQSQRALHVLRSTIGTHTYFAAGVPWFVALFGRDSLITAVQTLAYDPLIAEQTLRLLASYQGQREDRWREEQPGKILHELRVGEKARLGHIPHTPYYGSIDATLLFLILVGRHAAWTGQLTVFMELQSHIDAALKWMTQYGNSNGNGYLEYERISEGGLANQGWKDSGDAIVNDDGSLATPPIALVEVQAYAYEAWVTLASLYRQAGQAERATRLEQNAAELRDRFNRDFWLEEQGIYALARHKEGRVAAVVSSNAGHALWGGIADADQARRTVDRLMDRTMYSGWGIRTLSDGERRYNPMGYHLGTVWPHDNSIIAAGFRRYGYADAAVHVFKGLVEAGMHFEGYQLPELFCGFSREDYLVPVRYPVACHPQAWASASIPYLVETVLGLQPEAFANRLRIVRPLLPEFLTFIELRGVTVGQAKVDLRFERTAGRTARAEVLQVEGVLQVEIEA